MNAGRDRRDHRLPGPNAGLYYYDGHGAMQPTRQNFPVAAVPSFTDLR
jgi:hypothetical protein